MCRRPAVSAMSTSTPRAVAACRASKITEAESAPECWATTGTPLRSPQALELLHRRSAEGVAGGQHHAVALLLEALGQLTDGRGLARPVHAHHKNDLRSPGRGLDYRCVAAGENGAKLVPQGAEQGLGIGELAAFYPAGDIVDDAAGRLDAHVCGQELRLQLFEQIVVDTLAPAHQVPDVRIEDDPGGRQTVLQP